jgi:hypothetical protein
MELCLFNFGERAEGKVKVVSGDLEEWVEMIRGKKGKDIWLVGGVTWCGNFSRRE